MNEQSCGAASLCMVYHYYGLKHQTQEKIWTRLKKQRALIPNQESIYITDIYNDIRTNGLHTILGQAVWNDSMKIFALLEEFLKIGVPIIVNQRWRENQPLGHFKVITGLNTEHIIVNDPEFTVNPTIIPYQKFISDWQNYSVETPGGWFVTALNEEQIKKIRILSVMEFRADVKNFDISNLNFLP